MLNLPNRKPRSPIRDHIRGKIVQLAIISAQCVHRSAALIRKRRKKFLYPRKNLRLPTHSIALSTLQTSMGAHPMQSYRA
jgi:hypothetical protein